MWINTYCSSSRLKLCILIMFLKNMSSVNHLMQLQTVNCGSKLKTAWQITAFVRFSEIFISEIQCHQHVTKNQATPASQIYPTLWQSLDLASTVSGIQALWFCLDQIHFDPKHPHCHISLIKEKKKALIFMKTQLGYIMKTAWHLEPKDQAWLTLSITEPLATSLTDRNFRFFIRNKVYNYQPWALLWCSN